MTVRKEVTGRLGSMHLGVSEADVLPVSPKSVSTPERKKCIGWPEQKYISEAGKGSRIGGPWFRHQLGSDYPPAYPSWQGMGVACSD